MQPVSLLLFEGDWILIQLAWWPLKPHSPCNAAKGVSVHVRSYMFVQLNHLFPGHLCASSNWSIAWRTWLLSNRTVPDFIHSAFWRVLLASPLLPLTISFTLSKAKKSYAMASRHVLSMTAYVDALVPSYVLEQHTLLTSTADFCKNNKIGKSSMLCSLHI